MSGGIRDYPGARLSRQQRVEVLEWVAAGDNYTAIREKLEARGFPLINRQAVHYYRKHLQKSLTRAHTCPTCGQAVPHLAT